MAGTNSNMKNIPNKCGVWSNGRASYLIIWIVDVFPGHFVVDLGADGNYCHFDAAIVESETWVFIGECNFKLK